MHVATAVEKASILEWFDRIDQLAESVLHLDDRQRPIEQIEQLVERISEIGAMAEHPYSEEERFTFVIRMRNVNARLQVMTEEFARLIEDERVRQQRDDEGLPPIEPPVRPPVQRRREGPLRLNEQQVDTESSQEGEQAGQQDEEQNEEQDREAPDFNQTI